MTKATEVHELVSLKVEFTERSLEEQVEHIADWLEETGGFNPAESPPPSLEALAQSMSAVGRHAVRPRVVELSRQGLRQLEQKAVGIQSTGL